MSTLFDDNLQPTPEAVTDEAIARADEHADERWKQVALSAVRICCLERPTFTTDDVHEILARVAAGVSTHEPRALGAIMRKARSEGWCVPTGETRDSARLVAHRNPKRVWRSLIWGAV